MGEDGDFLLLSMVEGEIPFVEASKLEVMVVDLLYGCYTLLAPVACYIMMETLEQYSKDFQIRLTHLMKVLQQAGSPVFDVSCYEWDDLDQHCYNHNLQLQT